MSKKIWNCAAMHMSNHEEVKNGFQGLNIIEFCNEDEHSINPEK